MKIQPGNKHNTVIYIDGNTRTVHRGGSKAWRMNNPGNIKSSSWTKRHGSIGEIENYAAWPDYESGRKAYFDLVTGPTYGRMRIDNALRRLVPYFENDTEKFIRQVKELSGVNVYDKKFGVLDVGEITRILDAVQQLEGFAPGDVFVQKIITAAKQRHGIVTKVLFQDDGEFITLEQAIARTRNDEVDAVVVDGRFLRSRPDDTYNLDDIATEE